MTDQTFRNYNKLFVLSFKNGANDSMRNFYGGYYMSLVEIKPLIDSKPFFD